MKKNILISMVVGMLLFSVIGAFQLQTVYNPFTSRLDYTVTSNFTGDWLTCHNLTVENVTLLYGNMTAKKYSHFGNSTDYAQFNAEGDLSFVGRADSLVSGDSYVFRYDVDEDLGMYLDSAGKVDIKTINNITNVYLGASDGGASYFKGAVGIGAEPSGSALEVRGGNVRFGNGTDYAQVDDDGDLNFFNYADFLVSGNRYAFRYSGDEDVGLYFDEGNTRFSFLDTSAVAQQWFNIDGTTYFGGDTTIGEDLILQDDLDKVYFGGSKDVSQTMDGANFNVTDEIGSIPFNFIGFSEYDFDNNVDVQGNISINSLIKLEVNILPVCSMEYNGTIMRNSSGIYGCSHAQIWTLIF